MGIILTVVSAFAFGSGALFAKPVYAAGVGWHELMAWRFLIGAAAAWVWIALYPPARAGLRRMDRRALAVSVALGVLYTGNSATYYAGLEEVFLRVRGGVGRDEDHRGVVRHVLGIAGNRAAVAPHRLRDEQHARIERAILA